MSSAVTSSRGGVGAAAGSVRWTDWQAVTRARLSPSKGRTYEAGEVIGTSRVEAGGMPCDLCKYRTKRCVTARSDRKTAVSGRRSHARYGPPGSITKRRYVVSRSPDDPGIRSSANVLTVRDR